MKATSMYYSRFAYKVEVMLLLLDEPNLKRKIYYLKTFNPFTNFLSECLQYSNSLQHEGYYLKPTSTK